MGNKQTKRARQTNIKKVGGKTRSTRTHMKKIIIGKIYADWCGHCVRLKPEWDSMKNMIKQNMGYSLKNVNIEFIELGDNEENRAKNISVDQLLFNFNQKHFPHGEKQIQSDGFPTIFKICRKKIEYYKGPRVASDMYKWVTQNC
jgi:thiol-disulfide isomerase/thioredoxin